MFLCSKSKRRTFDGTKSKRCFSYRSNWGVGSIAVMVLSKMGYDVHAVTGKKDKHEYLKILEQKIF